MDELQKARADWIAAQEKILSLEKRLSDVTQKNYELQMKLYVAEARADSAEAMYTGFARGMLGLTV